MRKKPSIAVLLSLGMLVFILSCQKPKEKNFTVTVGTQTITFDSLFAWVDTSSAAAGVFFVNVGAKDTKGQHYIYLAGMESPTKVISGTYFFNGSQISTLPSAYRWLMASNLFIASGANNGRFSLTGQNSSKLIIDRYTDSEIGGSFSIDLNPSLPNGAIDASTKISASGQFNVPYRVLP